MNKILKITVTAPLPSDPFKQADTQSAFMSAAAEFRDKLKGLGIDGVEFEAGTSSKKDATKKSEPAAPKITPTITTTQTQK